MYRFLLRPKWIGFHLLVVAGIVTMVNLGFWQLRRLDDRREFNAAVEARYDAPPVGLDTLVGDRDDPDDDALGDVVWRPVTAAGTYDDAGSFRVVNRSQGGRAGENVVTPLQLGDGRTLLVNRGFVPLDEPVPAPPTGAVEIVGRLRETQRRGTGQLSDPADGPLDVVQRVDIARLAEQFGGNVVPMYVDLLESSPPDGTPYPEAVQPPSLDEGSHLSYAVQWLIFSVAVGVGWVLAVRRSVATRRRAAATPAPTPR